MMILVLAASTLLQVSTTTTSAKSESEWYAHRRDYHATTYHAPTPRLRFGRLSHHLLCSPTTDNIGYWGNDLVQGGSALSNVHASKQHTACSVHTGPRVPCGCLRVYGCRCTCNMQQTADWNVHGECGVQLRACLICRPAVRSVAARTDAR